LQLFFALSFEFITLYMCTVKAPKYLYLYLYLQPQYLKQLWRTDTYTSHRRKPTLLTLKRRSSLTPVYWMFLWFCHEEHARQNDAVQVYVLCMLASRSCGFDCERARCDNTAMTPRPCLDACRHLINQLTLSTNHVDIYASTTHEIYPCRHRGSPGACTSCLPACMVSFYQVSSCIAAITDADTKSSLNLPPLKWEPMMSITAFRIPRSVIAVLADTRRISRLSQNLSFCQNYGEFSF